MKKTKCVFEFDYENEVVFNKIKEGCEWVLSDDAIPTLKLDGSSCLFKDGILWKRYDRKLLPKFNGVFSAGDKPDLSCFKTPPEGFVPCEESYDPNTFHWPGWVPIGENDKLHREAFENSREKLIDGKTYELMGSKVLKNTGGLDRHELFLHGDIVLDVPNRSFEGIKEFLTNNYIEGIVFHNKKDGRLTKITRRHFGLFWKEEDKRKKRK